MGWIVAIVILVLLVVSAGFRVFALGLLALAVVAGGIYYVWERREERLSLSRISPSELTFEGVTLSPEYGGYKLAGRVTNKSQQYTLQQLNLSVTAHDCAPESKSRECVIIGESEEYLYLNIPPGQARNFDESVYFSGGPLKVNGQFEWKYNISRVEGK